MLICHKITMLKCLIDDHNDIDKDDNDDILGITAKNTYIYM